MVLSSKENLSHEYDDCFFHNHCEISLFRLRTYDRSAKRCSQKDDQFF